MFIQAKKNFRSTISRTIVFCGILCTFPSSVYARAVGGGAGNNSHFGHALAVGDFDNDGDDDLVVGAPWAFVGSSKPSAGQITIMWGDHLQDEQGGHAWYTGYSGNTNLHLDTSGVGGTATAWDYWGLALAVGDFDGDGCDDIAIGAPPGDVDGESAAGFVTVLYGSTSRSMTSGDQTWTQNSSGVADSADASDRFGDALAAGDFNGDGYDDLAIGVPGESVSGDSGAGMVQILYGTSSGLSSSGDQSWHQDISGIGGATQANDRFGSSLVAGDLNGDGYDDLAIGVPHEDIDGEPDSGAVNVIYGGSSGLSSTGSQFWHQNTSGIVNSCEEDDFFGHALAIGDFDNDGYGDLTVGVPYEDIGSSTEHRDAGAVHVIYGSPGGLTSSGNQIWTQDTSGISETAAPYDYFGKAVATGDLDSDGYDDLVIGAPGERRGDADAAGAVHIIYGSSNGITSTGDVLLREQTSGSWDYSYPNYTFSSAGENEQFGYAVVVGDFTADVNDPVKNQIRIGAPGEFDDYLDTSGGLADRRGKVFIYTPEMLDAVAPTYEWAYLDP